MIVLNHLKFRTMSENNSRRKFIQQSALFGAGIMLTGPQLFAVNHNHFKQKNKMKTRKLGKLEVSELGLGCMNMAGNYNGSADKQQSIRTIRTAFENGFRF